MDDDPTLLFQTMLASDGVLAAPLDMPGRSMNGFSAGLMGALHALVAAQPLAQALP